MTDVEALLEVDAGRIPPGVVAFFPRDPEAPARRMKMVMAIATAVTALACAMADLGREPVALLLLTAGILGVTATRTEPEEPERTSKQPVLVVTPNAMIVRDDSGLRRWEFDDLVSVRPIAHRQRVVLLVETSDGARDVIDNLLFQRGEDLRELIGQRLKPHQA
jgi:hypothetical protein